jgi:EAL domain-containing protein (putative c-di-GMP-specific phosphodiesterase class I)
MRLEDKTTVAVELMPTWHHPLQGPLAWRELLALADREGLAASLVLNVLERGAHALSRWLEDGAEVALFAPIPVAAPFRSELVGDVKAVIARANLPAGALQLAVSELVVADNPEFAVQLMRRLREAGAAPWLDEFGKCATWLSYLERLPIEGVRFDEIVTAQKTGGRRARILKPLVALAGELDVATLAGGVDTPQDAIELYGAGVELAAGALFGRPANAQGIAQQLSTVRAAAE